MAIKKQSVIRIEQIGFQWEMENPFLFCAHHEDDYPAGNKNQGIDPNQLRGREVGNDFVVKDGYRMYHGQEVPGFPVHPHRGFETVTIVTKGYVDHFDSLGAYGRYGQGDVQWMTAGKGCQHAEMFPLVHENEPNPLELFQIWLNLPKKDKFVNAAFKMLWHEDIPVVEERSQNGKKTAVTVVAGSWRGQAAVTPAPDSWAVDPSHQVGIFLIYMEAGSTVSIPATSPTSNRNLYFFKGDAIRMDGQKVGGSNRIKLASDQDITIDNGDSASELLLLQAEPIDEPVVKYGPFVMNTMQEIQDAFSDYRRTHFGGWPFEQEIPVNARNAKRFAHYANGGEETRKD
ncbi:MAG: pirin family protein [Clostridiaceae bacterium]|jgi:redox-sensitive bicupin YhaK (pirin superfamily)|nr:pirin family protein [Clostridiaceae bacterium]